MQKIPNSGNHSAVGQTSFVPSPPFARPSSDTKKPPPVQLAPAGRTRPPPPARPQSARWVILGIAAFARRCKTCKPPTTANGCPIWRCSPGRRSTAGRSTIHKSAIARDRRSPDDYTVRYYDKTLDLGELNSAYLIVVPFPGSVALAHTMLSFGFADRDFLGVSAEVRRKKREELFRADRLAGAFPDDLRRRRRTRSGRPESQLSPATKSTCIACD